MVKDDDVEQAHEHSIHVAETGAAALQELYPAWEISSATYPGPPDEAILTAAKNYGTLGTRVSRIDATPVFPFSSPVSVYAGSCDGNNPNPTGVANPVRNR